MFGRNDLITYYLLERITVAASLHLRIGKSRNNANDSFGKGFRVLKDHVLNRLMTGRARVNTAVTAEVPLAFSPK